MAGIEERSKNTPILQIFFYLFQNFVLVQDEMIDRNLESPCWKVAFPKKRDRKENSPRIVGKRCVSEIMRDPWRIFGENSRQCVSGGRLAAGKPGCHRGILLL